MALAGAGLGQPNPDPVKQAQLVQALAALSGQKLNPSGKDSCVQCLAAIASIALLVIGSMGVAGHFTNPTFGWVVAGLGGGAFIANLAYGNLKERKWLLISGALIAAIYVTVGILGGMNMLTSVQVGWGVVGPLIASMGLGCCFGCCGACYAICNPEKAQQGMLQAQALLLQQQQQAQYA